LDPLKPRHWAVIEASPGAWVWKVVKDLSVWGGAKPSVVQPPKVTPAVASNKHVTSVPTSSSLPSVGTQATCRPHVQVSSRSRPFGKGPLASLGKPTLDP